MLFKMKDDPRIFPVGRLAAGHLDGRAAPADQRAEGRDVAGRAAPAARRRRRLPRRRPPPAAGAARASPACGRCPAAPTCPGTTRSGSTSTTSTTGRWPTTCSILWRTIWRGPAAQGRLLAPVATGRLRDRQRSAICVRGVSQVGNACWRWSRCWPPWPARWSRCVRLRSPARDRHRRRSGPPTRCCTPPALAAEPLRAGLTAAAAAKAVRHLRTLVGAVGLAIADGDALLAFDGRGEPPQRPVGRGRRAGRWPPAGRPCSARADLPCDRVDCVVRGAVVAPLTGAGRPGRRPRWSRSADDQPAPGLVQATAGDGPLGRLPARPRRAGLVPGAAGPGRGAGAARADQPALHLQRADRDRARSCAPTRSAPAS